jgi:hypothetical protein
MLSVAIIYRSPDGRPLSVATVENREFLAHAAAEAIGEAYSRAEELTLRDPVLGRIQREEADKLSRVLSVLLPVTDLTPATVQ